MKTVEHGFTLIEDELIELNREWEFETRRSYREPNFKRQPSFLANTVSKISEALCNTIVLAETQLFKEREHRIHKTRLNDW